MKKPLKYAISGSVCLALAAWYCLSRGFSQLTLAEKYRTLCDAFTVPGIVCLCVGVLIWVAGDGIFHGLGYCLSVTRRALFPTGRREQETYYDYVQRRRQKNRPACGFLLITGSVCMLIAVTFLAAYYVS